MSSVTLVTADSFGLNLTGTTFDTQLPSDCQVGDAILAYIFTAGDIITAPTGWTLVLVELNSTPEGIYVYKKDSVSPTDNDVVTDPWTRNDLGPVTIVLYQFRCDTGATVVVEGHGSKRNANVGYSTTGTLSSVISTVAGSMFTVGVMSKLFDNTSNPVSVPSPWIADSSMTRPENGRHVWAHVATGPDTDASTLTFDPFVLSPNSSSVNTLWSAIVLLSPAGGGGGGSGVSYDADTTDTFRCNDQLANAARVRLVLTDEFETIDDADAILAKIIQETLRIQEVLRPNEKFGVASTETIQIASRLLAGSNLALTEGIGIHEIAKALYAARMVEKLGLQGLFAARMSYGASIVNRIRMQDALRRFFAADVTEGLGLAEALAEKIVLNGRLIDAVGIAPDLTAHMLLRMTVSDKIVLDDVELLKMIFAGRLVDGVQISALHVEPNGSITTWAINTKSGSVTEYGNYAFNSFAAMGGRYLGASDTGLYALDGDDDTGTPIIAHIKGGFMQFGNMHMSSIKGVYLGIRGAGDFVLKIETGDKKVYVYALKARDFETTRVRPGKGLRARFFRFELISAGQDFDLEAVEFIPVVATRRG